MKEDANRGSVKKMINVNKSFVILIWSLACLKAVPKAKVSHAAYVNNFLVWAQRNIDVISVIQ